MQKGEKIMTILDLKPIITDIIGAVDTKDNNIICDESTREKIKRVAEYSRGTSLYKETAEEREKLIKKNADANAAEVYMFLLERIIHAPTTLHMFSSVIILLPLVDELMDKPNSILGSVYHAK